MNAGLHVRSHAVSDRLDIGFRSAIACQMAARSYREGRTVTWDETREGIV